MENKYSYLMECVADQCELMDSLDEAVEFISAGRVGEEERTQFYEVCSALIKRNDSTSLIVEEHIRDIMTEEFAKYLAN